MSTGSVMLRGILKFDAQVADGTVHLRVAKQELDRAKIACLAVDLRCLRAPQRVRPVAARFETDRRHPLPDEPYVLARRDVRPVVKPAREQEGAQEKRLRKATFRTSIAMTSRITAMVTLAALSY
ncbi:hypothetical protein GCM10011324_39070 [Allosediminivita pacifica]|nr:hypothetical protein GCM10011324_39070 [Allosediminivita pacifica]